MWAQENSVIDPGHQARTTQFFTTPAVKAQVRFHSAISGMIQERQQDIS
jgi:hypothetical protein